MRRSLISRGRARPRQDPMCRSPSSLILLNYIVWLKAILLIYVVGRVVDVGSMGPCRREGPASCVRVVFRHTLLFSTYSTTCGACGKCLRSLRLPGPESALLIFQRLAGKPCMICYKLL